MSLHFLNSESKRCFLTNKLIMFLFLFQGKHNSQPTIQIDGNSGVSTQIVFISSEINYRIENRQQNKTSGKLFIICFDDMFSRNGIELPILRNKDINCKREPNSKYFSNKRSFISRLLSSEISIIFGGQISFKFA